MHAARTTRVTSSLSLLLLIGAVAWSAAPALAHEGRGGSNGPRSARRAIVTTRRGPPVEHRISAAPEGANFDWPAPLSRATTGAPARNALRFLPPSNRQGHEAASHGQTALVGPAPRQGLRARMVKAVADRITPHVQRMLEAADQQHGPRPQFTLSAPREDSSSAEAPSGTETSLASSGGRVLLTVPARNPLLSLMSPGRRMFGVRGTDEWTLFAEESGEPTTLTRRIRSGIATRIHLAMPRAEETVLELPIDTESADWTARFLTGSLGVVDMQTPFGPQFGTRALRVAGLQVPSWANSGRGLEVWFRLKQAGWLDR